MTTAYIGLGSNLGDRDALIRRAAELIGATRLSSVIETELAPRQLLDHLLDVERRLGRERVGPQWGPRTIDLDLLLYGDERIDEPGLQVPHPRLHEREFVLEPLAELDPGLEIPGRGAVQALLAGL